MTIEPPEHPRRLVANGVDMFADRDDAVGIADPDPYSVAHRLADTGFKFAVESRLDQRETDLDPLPPRAVVASRDFAEDAVGDRVIVDLHPNCLGDIERPVLGDHDVACEVADPLLGRRRNRQRQ